MIAPRLAAVLALAALAACSPRRIPGTEILDSPETRELVAVVEAYQQAAERRDAEAILGLVSTRYFDDAGTPDPADDIDYGALAKLLPLDMARVASVRLEIKVIDVKVDGDKAQVFLRYDARYRIATRSAEVPKLQADQSRMLLLREKGAWKIVSGL